MWAVWGVVLAILFGPSLFAGGVALPLEMLRGGAPWRQLAPSPWPVNRLQWDQLVELTPWQATVRRALGDGEWPLWNRYLEAGMPLMADPQSQALSPLVAASYPLPLPAAVGVTKALRVLVALVFTFLFLRRQRAGEGAALLASLAYGLSGFVLLWAGWGHATSAALLPTMLYALAVSADRGARRDFLLTGTVAFALLLGGHPETLAYPVAVSGVYALTRLVRRRPAAELEGTAPAAPRSPGALPGRGRLLAGWSLAGGVALAAAAPVLLPTAAYLPQSLRARQTIERAESLRNFHPFAAWRTPAGRHDRLATMARLVVPIAAPNAYGNNRFGEYWGQQNVNEDATGFAGTAALLAALLALIPRRRGAFRLPRERLMMAVGAVALVLVARVPGVFEAVMRSPLGIWSSASHHRILMLLTFVTAYLAAASWERWRRGELPRWAPAALALPLGAAIVWAYVAIPGSAGPSEPGTLAGLRYASLAVQLLALAASAALLTWRPPTVARARLATAALLAVVAGELLFFHLPANPPAPRRLFYPPTPAIEYLQQHAGTGRIMATDLLLLPNSASVFGLADLRGSSPVKPWDLHRELMLINGNPGAPVDFVLRTDRPLLDLFAVRFALTAPRERLQPPWRRVFNAPDAWVWRRPTALPPLFLPRAAEPAGANWVAQVAKTEDFAARSLFAAPPEMAAAGAAPPAGWRAADPDGSTLGEIEVGSHRVRTRALLAEPRLLATSIYQDGGWRVLAGGERRPALRTNGPLVGAWLPAGAYAVELLYRPPGFLAGCLLAALGLAVAAAWWAGPGGSRGCPT